MNSNLKQKKPGLGSLAGWEVGYLGFDPVDKGSHPFGFVANFWRDYT
jgi:hypothetical protein